MKAFASLAIALLLAGCGSGTPTVPQSVSSAQARHSSGGDLLYVSSFRERQVTIFSYPAEKRIITLKFYAYVTGLCSDASGNVWVVTVNDAQGAMYKYPHGGTSPIATLTFQADSALGCAVDPMTGDLAVVHDATDISIFPNASGSPVTYKDYTLGFFPYSTTYDGSGNLFVYAAAEPSPVLAELPYKGPSLIDYAFNEKIRPPTVVLWNGTTLFLGGSPSAKKQSTTESIWSVAVSASGLQVTPYQTFDSGRKRNRYFGQFASLTGQTLIQINANGNFVNSYDFQTGGKPIHTIAGLHGGTRSAITLSVAPSK